MFKGFQLALSLAFGISLVGGPLFAQAGSPTISASPAPSEYPTGTVLTVSVIFCDNGGLDTASRTLTINNVSVKDTWTKLLTYETPGSCYARFVQTGQVTVPATIRASIEDNTGLWSRIQTFAFLVPPAWTGLRVSAEQVYLDVAPSAAGTQRFRVSNIGDASLAMTFASVNQALTSVGSPSPASATVLPESTIVVTVTTTAGSVSDSSGRVWLRATSGTLRDSAFTQLTSLSPPAVTNGVTLLNPNGMADRSRCVSIAAGADAAYECGDLLLTYPLPAIQTRARGRIPTLLYHSNTAHPYPVIPAELGITAPVGGETYTATVVMTAGGPLSGQSFAAGSWLATDWGSGGRRRITATFDGASIPTGRHPFRLDVTRTGGTTYSATGELLVVNRLASPFNAGWWLAGLEQLVLTSDTAAVITWVGGDASVRAFRRVAGTCVWVGDPLARVDSIVAAPVGQQCSAHTRRGANALRVEFDAQGRHVRTINRLADTTRFVYGVGGRLDTIAIPSRNQLVRYVFGYDGAGALDRVELPLPSPEASRIVRIRSRTGAVVAGASRARTDSIWFRDSAGVRLEYGGSPAVNGSGPYRISGRRDRLNLLARFAYDGSQRLTESRVMANATDTVINTFRAGEGLARGTGVAGAALVADSVYTSLDGPRKDAIDITKWWLNALGAPLRVRDPVGSETRIRYSTTRPALPTQMHDAAGLLTRATYTQRGLVDTLRVSAPLEGTDALTTVQWHAMFDSPTLVIDPNNVRSYRSYNDTTGLLLAERTGDSTYWNTRYEYDAARMLRRVYSPGAAVPDSIEYEGELGNVRRTRSPRGVIIQRLQDRLGRDTLVIEPIDAVTDTSNKVQRTRIAYDSIGRVKETVVSASSMPYSLLGAPVDTLAVQAESLFTKHSYNREGWLTVVNSYARPNLLNAASCNDSTPGRECAGAPPGYEGTYDLRTYDNLGRLLTRRLGLGPKRSVYDLAGNVIADTMWSGAVVTARYDAANRLVRRVVPARSYGQQDCQGFLKSQMYTDTECWMDFPIYPTDAAGNFTAAADTVRFAFDYAGRLARADNKDARIARSYFVNGALRTDTLRIRSYTSSSFSVTAFGSRYGYDVGGRRTSHLLPSNLGVDTVTYSYDSQRGYLRVATHDNSHIRIRLDTTGRQDSLVISRLDGTGTPVAGIIERRSYDADGNLRWRDRRRATGANLVNDSLSYDARGKIRVVRSSSAVLDAGLYTATTAYAGLGAVVANERYRDQAWWDAEQFRVTGLGQVYYSRSDKSAETTPGPIRQYFNLNGAVSSRRLFVTASVDTALYNDTLSTGFAAGGSILQQSSRATNNGLQTYIATRHYYSADERLIATQRYHYQSGNARNGAWEEFRYDALGRRVLSRTRRNAGNIYTALCGAVDCNGTVERTVWDGDQVLYELRADGSDARTPTDLDQLSSTGPLWGRAGYVHLGGIDQPLVTVDGRVPNYNWRGQPESSSWTDGAPADCSLSTSACTTIAWPQTTVYYKAPPWSTTGGGPTPQWVGTVLANGAGSTGLLYRRNRYYSPETGQFTQPDPIGLAGGLNLYGYANGDPINFSDPFGLCPLCIGWAVVEAAMSVADAVDLGITAAKFVAGRASRAELGVTAAGAAAGLVAPGGGLGRGGRLALNASESWGSAGTLARHFRDHGAGVGARSATEYADMASDFLQRGLRDGLPTKVDANGVIRVYDPSTNTFGAFNPDGTTRTFFKPTSKTYGIGSPERRHHDELGITSHLPGLRIRPVGVTSAGLDGRGLV